MHGFTRADLAQYARMSPAGMLACTRALAHYPDTRPHLARNPLLPSLVWRQLWSDRPAVADAIAMVSRPLSQPDREHVLATESRVKVLAALVRHNTLSLADQQSLARKAPLPVLEVLADQSWTDPELRAEIATRLTGLTLLREMAFGPLDAFDDAVVAARLADFDTWMPEESFKQRSGALKMLLVRRPHLLEAACSSSSLTVLTAAAGTLGLSEEQALRVAGVGTVPDAELAARGFTLLAVVSNPSVPAALASQIATSAGKAGLGQVRSTFKYRENRPEKVGDPSTTDVPQELSWLLHRSLPSSYHEARTADLLLLARNPHLGDADRSAVIEALLTEAHADWRVRAVLADEPALASAVAEEFSTDGAVPEAVDSGWTLLERFCSDAEAAIGSDDGKWEALAGLLDEFEGTPEELIAVAAAL